MKTRNNEELFEIRVTNTSASMDCKSILNRTVAAFLILICSFIYFATYDSPASLMNIIENIFRVKAYQFEYLYTFYGIPSTVVCVFSGLLFDKVLGLYKGSLLVVFIALSGQILITIGGFTISFWTMVLGRFVYGIGTESFIVALNCFIVRWFRGKEINLIFGLFQCLMRLGSSYAFLTSVPLYKLLEGSGKISDKYIFGLTITPFLFLVILEVFIICFLSLLTYKNESSLSVTDSKQHEFKIIYVLKLPLKFWLVSLMGVVSTANVYSFVSVSQQLLQNKYGLSLNEANGLSTYFNIFSAVSAPVIGVAVNKLKNVLTLDLVSILLGVVSQIMIAATMINPYVPLTMFSLSMNIVTIANMPLIGDYVEDYQLGTAYGIFQSLMNAFTALFQMAVGYILDTGGANWVAGFIIICLVVGSFFIIQLIVLIKKEKDNGSE